MFLHFARLRVIAITIFLYVQSSYARDESLFTSSVTYCEPPETLLIQRFDVAYIAHNQSVFFNISAASVEANVNVSASLLVNVYGLTPVNVSIDLCNILGGALCPLPMYNFTGSQSLSLPDSLGVAQHIPGIAYKVPDLEGFAQLTLTEVGTGKVKACVQATLANGWSTHQTAVEWSTGGVTLLFLIIAIWHSLSFESLVPYRFLDLFSLYQTVASTAFLNLNYPSLYRSFTLNFAWSMGLLSSATSGLQNSIDNMRHLTGGNLANATSGSAVGLVNRKLSPYNVPTTSNLVLPQTLFSLAEQPSTVYDRFNTLAASYSQPLLDHVRVLATDDEVQTVTGASANVLQAGVPIYVNSIHIGTANAFMTVFLVTLIVIAIALALFGLGFLSILAVQHVQSRRGNVQSGRKSVYWSFVRSWSHRLALVLLFPILIFAFYQWTVKDSWLSVFISVITFLAITGYIGYSSFRTIQQARRSRSEVYDFDANHDHVAPLAFLYDHYRSPRYYFFALFPVACLLKAVFIAAARSNGLAQVILLLIVEVFTLAALLVLRPHKTRGADVIQTFLAIVRVVCTGVLLAFVERLNVAPIIRTAIGAVIAVIFSVAILVMIINLTIHTIKPLIRGRKSLSRSSTESNDSGMLEKGSWRGSETHSTGSRPMNPSPEQNIPLDPAINEPYPPVTPTTASHLSTHTRTRESASTTFGSVLPRRWSITPLSSPTDSSKLGASPQDSNLTLAQSPESPSALSMNDQVRKYAADSYR